jgi:hypothetical protein
VRELFAARFALPGIADAFKAVFEAGQEANRAILDSSLNPIPFRRHEILSVLLRLNDGLATAKDSFGKR